MGRPWATSWKLAWCSTCRKSFRRGSRRACSKKLFCSKACVKGSILNDSGRYITSHGYVMVRVPKDYPYPVKKTNKAGWIYEHVLKATLALGRLLKKGEVVHHIDCNPGNNANTNLLICDVAYHRWLHEQMGRAWAKEHMRRVG